MWLPGLFLGPQPYNPLPWSRTQGYDYDTKVFGMLDFQAGYHQLPIQEEGKAKTTFWGVNSHSKDCLYQWKFLSFGLKNTLVEFQLVMDRILTWLDFVRCYINDIMVYSDTVEEH
jgi:hypothetical protein